ncbi:hypothetical protein WA158_003602 [Blastocystis sp. Blastoise]
MFANSLLRANKVALTGAKAFATATKASISGFFNAKSYVVVGASLHKGAIGNIIAKDFADSFKGEVHYVNPKGGELFGRKVYKNVVDIPQGVEGACIAVAAKFAVQAIKDCLAKGVKYIVIVTGGFAESGSAEGKEAQKEIVRLAKEHGARIIGPNCMGIYDPEGVDTLFIGPDRQAKPGSGPAGCYSQSGALGCCLMNQLAGEQRDPWVSKFMSVGNSCDVDETDGIQFFKEDEKTKQCWFYLEGFHNAPQFLKTAEETTSNKPVLLLKANRGASGAKASASHSASLAANDSVCDALVKRSGIIRCDTWDDLYLIGNVIRTQPLPKGRRIAVVTDAGGFGVLLADACDLYNMKLGEFDPATKSTFKKTFPPYYICNNPMDLTGSVQMNEFIGATHLALDDPNIDSVILAIQPGAPALPTPSDLATLIEKNFGPGKTKKPLVILEFGGKHPSDEIIRKELVKAGMAVFSAPTDAMKVLSKLASYKEYLDNTNGRSKTYKPVNVQDINYILDNTMKEGRYVLTETEGYSIFQKAGIPVPNYSVFTKGSDAGSFVENNNKNGNKKYVVKVVSPDILHKTDVGGVKLNLKDPQEVSDLVNEMYAKFTGMKDKRIQGIMVSEMVNGGTEMMIGANRDATFGPIVVDIYYYSGIGGTLVEVLKDVSFNMCPSTVEQNMDLINSLKNQKILNGGQPALNKPLFADILTRVSSIMAECGQIKEIDINPLVQSHDGSLTAVDSVFTLRK